MICALVIGILLIPDSASAWGPISHLAHGSEILKTCTILGGGLQQLLCSHPMEYLYGCIGADIIVGKKYTGAMRAHCHSWEVAWQILAATESEAEHAFAYGYLSHLAADVYSHNHFIPIQLVVSFRARALRHVYWEVRFDSMQDPAYRGIVSDLRRQRFPTCDALVERVVARTIFSFRTNKRIFDGVLAFHDWENWHLLMQGMSTRSRHHLPDAIVARYNDASSRNITDLLRRGKKADCQAADPAGLEALTLAKSVRRTLKALHRHDAITPEIERRLRALNQRGDLAAKTPTGAAPAVASALG